jgi:hypothetical protein
MFIYLWDGMHCKCKVQTFRLRCIGEGNNDEDSQRYRVSADEDIPMID